ncbi:MAG: TatD family hydrolase [Candidatus Thorarchaeota archaeon]
MRAIDTHCHLLHTIKKGAKLGNIIKNAENANVIAMIDSPVYLEDYAQAIRFHKSYPKQVFITLGSSPASYHEVDIEKTIEQIKIFTEKGQIVGIGEVGLDYYWVKNHNLRERQHLVFSQFIELANELQMPLVIHSREAEDDALIDLQKAETQVVMHSYGGSIETAQKCVDRGYFISIPTCVTTRKKHRNLVMHLPIESLLTETDSPYLSPFPEEKRNEPANVIYGVKEIAKLKEISEDEVAEITTRNAIKIFNLPF